MTEQLQGVIDNIYTKSVNTKYGEKPVYHAMINGLDVNLGFKCAYIEGESVTLQVENGKYGYELAKGVPQSKTSNNAGVAGTGQNPVATARSAPAEFPVPKNTKGIAICRQNSSGHAARIVAALVTNGCITNENDAMESFMRIAYEITDFSTGHREAKQAEAIQAYQGEDE